MTTKMILICWLSLCTALASETLGFAQGAGSGQPAGTALLAPKITPSPQIEPLGLFDGHCDLGSPAIAGSASYDPARQAYTLAAGGINIWGTNDQCHFLWKKMTGDFILRARLNLAAPGAVEHRKIGWMLRSGLAANAAFVDGVVENGEGLTSLQYRPINGGRCAMAALPLKTTGIIQLERRGSNYIFSAALSSEPFVSTNCAAVSLPDDVYAGLCICAHGPNLKEAVVFRDVQIIHPAK